jgi:serine/threonine protein phosphatase PrpC
MEDRHVVARGGHGLMVTRALGDRWFRPVGVIGVPEVTELELPADARALIAATDGLWDPQPAADAPVAAALDAGTHDNVPAVVLDVPAWSVT